MDRTWTKPPHAEKRKKKRIKPYRSGAQRRQQLTDTQLRLVVASLLLASIVGLVLLTSGPAARRMMLFALPVGYVLPEADMHLEDPAPADISILRVDVDEGVGEEMRIEVLRPSLPQATTLGGDEPRILVYHTHTTEAYTQTDTYTYAESSEWRTEEHEKSIVAVGAELARILREEYGCNVLHDTTNHEPPQLSSSYNRSVVTMEEYKKRYPSITMFIDVHRDSGDGRYVILNGKRVARMMFVVGTGEGVTGTGFGEMPDFESNYALALDVTNRLAALDERLMRNIRVKTSRYNQHMSSQCLLVEMGDNGNTLEEALNAVPHLAKAIVESATGIQASEPTSGAPIWAPEG